MDSTDRMQSLRARLPHIAYGGDYNPEQWPQHVWADDVRLMQKAGVNLVSLGIFSWAHLEPQPDRYEFDWLDKIMDLLDSHGIAAALATPTAAPPAWLTHRDPSTLPVNEQGIRLAFGSRTHFCASSPTYHARAKALIQQLASRYASHPALALWHIGNEYSQYCYCDESARHFRHWLIERYQDIGALNEAWGTAFWGQRYGSWDEISPPRLAPGLRNPAHQLDYQRFTSDALLGCFTMERDLIRTLTPHIPVTTNFMASFQPLDYWRWAAEQDVVSLDIYPDHHDPRAHIEAALNFDLMRSLGGRRPWLLMEQATSAPSWREQNSAKPAGLMRLWSYQAVARGADSVMFFQWRASRSGPEKFHSAMLPHAGTASRVWGEVCELGGELKALDDVVGSLNTAEVALMWDWPNWWALEQEARPTVDLRYTDQLISHYQPLWESNVPVDIAHPEGDLTGYRLVIVPNLYLVTDAGAENLRRFVDRGGHLVMSFFSGIVDEADRVRPGGYPGAFRKLLGVAIEDFNPMQPGVTVPVRWDDGHLTHASLWQDVIQAENATVLARYDTGEYPGVPAVTRRRSGSGTVTYVGTRLDEQSLATLLSEACTAAGIQTASLPFGVEAVRRHSDSHSFLFLLNHGTEEATITLDRPGTNLLDGRRHNGELSLPGRGVAILREDQHMPSSTMPRRVKGIR